MIPLSVFLGTVALTLLVGAARNPLPAPNSPGNSPSAAYPVSCSRSMVIQFAALNVPLEYAVYGPITSCMAADLRSFVRTFLPYLRAAQMQGQEKGATPPELPTFTVSLNSPGGSWTDTLSMLDSLRLLSRLGKVPIEVVISGQVRADAVWLLSITDRRFIAPDALIVFEWPFQPPTAGLLRRGSPEPDGRTSAWLDPLARALRIPTQDLQDFLNRKAAFYGTDAIRMGWAKDIEQWTPDL